jgi:hypothetical protein
VEVVGNRRAGARDRKVYAVAGDSADRYDNISSCCSGGHWSGDAGRAPTRRGSSRSVERHGAATLRRAEARSRDRNRYSDGA